MEQFVIGQESYIKSGDKWVKAAVAPEVLNHIFNPRFPEVIAFFDPEFKDSIAIKGVSSEKLGDEECFVIEFTINDSGDLLYFLSRFYNLANMVL